MATNGDFIQCAGGSLGQHRHVCAFFNDLDEEHRVLRSFFKEGLDRGEKAVHIVEADKRQDYLNRLAEAEINVQEMMDTGRLEVLPWTDMYVRDHRFDQDAMLASVEELIQSERNCRLSAYQVGGASYGLVVSGPTSREQLGRIRGTPQSRSFELRRAGDLQLRYIKIQRKRSDGHHADAPARHHRWVAAGEPILCSAGAVLLEIRSAAPRRRENGRLTNDCGFGS